MSRFHTLKVQDVVRETPDAISIGLEVAPGSRQEFAFQAGQYLTVRTMLGGEDVRRSYSICSSPFEQGSLRIAVKKVQGGRMSTRLVDGLKAGDELEVMPPMGGFVTPMDPSNERHIVAFAGGSGITPVISIIRTVLHEEPGSRVTLFYGNSDPERVIFKSELERIERTHSGRCKVVFIVDAPERSAGFMGLFKGKAKDADPLHRGLLTEQRIAALLDAYVQDEGPRRYFTCGPAPMMENVVRVLEQRGVPKDLVHVELFTPPVAASAATAPIPASTDKAMVTVVLDGLTKEIEVPYKGPHILDVAGDAGMDVPYSCKGGVCSTCRAKVLEGKVEMDMNYALTDAEVAQGYVLTCQSHPRSPRVVVDFDQP